MMNEIVQTIMTKNPITLNKAAALSQVKSIFEQNRIHHIPIVDDEGFLSGLITTYDMWKLNSNFDDYSNIPVSDVMSKKVIKINAEDKVGTAAELFLDKRFHALPVVDDENHLVGIVTSFDVLKYEFVKEYDHPILYKEVLEGERAYV